MALLVGELRAALDLDSSKYDQGLDRSHARFGKFVKAAGLMSAAAGVAAAAGLLKLAKGAAEDEKAQAVLAKTLKNTARATDAQVASIEDYISKTGAAKGVTDDEMRPALANLVRATHDVGKAQSLMGLAMDVSAGTGKDLGAVTMALAKAQNGSVGGLAKLGIATKDASGKTKSFEQIQKDLAKTFTGQAAAAAETTSGKFDRLKLIVSEAGESIGAKVIPVLLTLATFLLNRVVPGVMAFGAVAVGIFKGRVLPVLQQFGEFLRSQVLPVVVSVAQSVVSFGQRILASVVPAVLNLVAAFTPLVRSVAGQLPGALNLLRGGLSAVGGILTSTVLPAIRSFSGFLKNNQTLVGAVAVGVGAMVAAFYAYKFALGVVSVATRAYAAVQAALNFVMSANPIGLVLIALVGLAAGLIYAYKHSETFRRIVDGAFRAVATVVRTVVGAVVGFFRDNWKRLPLLLLGPIGIVLFLFKGLPGRILGAVGNVAGTLAGKGRDFINGLADGAKAAWHNVTDFIGGRKQSVLNWIGAAKDWLKNKGIDIVNGLADGLKAAWHNVTDWVKGIGTWIKDHKGPISLDRTLLIDAGKAIMGGFLRGLKSGAGAAWKFVSSVGGKTVEMLGSALGGVGGVGGSQNMGFVGGSGVERWRGIALEALQLTGSPLGWIGSLLRRMNQESGGNPNAINLWDSNAKAGHPSQGLMQTIPGTFSAYAGSYASRGIRDPLANIIASIRYANARYGSAPRGWDRPGGYRLGTPWVPNDQFAYLHRGEGIIPAAVNRRMLAHAGTAHAGTVVHNHHYRYEFPHYVGDRDDLVKALDKLHQQRRAPWR